MYILEIEEIHSRHSAACSVVDKHDLGEAGLDELHDPGAMPVVILGEAADDELS